MFLFCAYLVSLPSYSYLMCPDMFHIATKLHSAIPTYLQPYMYKRDSEGAILLDRGDEYYDDSHPYGGVYIHFAKNIMEASSLERI